MNEFVSQFLVEARELTEQASASLLALERSPANRAHLDDAFRAFHTLKGAAAIMEYGPMERLLHKAEDLLQSLRSGKLTVTPDLIDGCLACVGQVIRWLDAVERTGEFPADAEAAATRVARQLGAAPADVPALPAASWVAELIEWANSSAPEAKAAITAVRYVPDQDALFRGEDPVAAMSALPGILALRLTPRAPWPALADLQPFNSNLIIEVLSPYPKAEVEASIGKLAGTLDIVELSTRARATPADEALVFAQLVEAQKEFVRVGRPVEAFAGAIGSAGRVIANALKSMGRVADAGAVDRGVALSLAETTSAALLTALDKLLDAPGEANAPGRADEPADGRREAGANAIRVDVARIDAIVDLTGELLVVKNALAHWTKLAAEGVDPAALVAGLRTQHARLDRHVSELQRAVLDLRVLPLARVFGRFPLLVRETAAKLGKQITFKSEGDDTEADKAVVEALFEPLLHVVRNAIDHGIEPPDIREQAGKPRAATILISGRREGDRVVVEVRDDGRGVDPTAIRRLAAERGLLDAEAAATLDDDEAAALIFAPGFTTATAVTDLSGRGVGMNAVRAAVERMGGEVSLDNRPGQGLAVQFTLPFTVMMTRVMTVEAGGQTFGLPFDAVQETVRAPRSQIRPLGGGEAFVLRDLTIPVLDLASSLGLEERKGQRPDTACLVIASVGGQRVGIEIERPGERLDMMLKPVEGVLAGMPAISGTSLLGDGRVLIVLDLGTLFG